MTKGIRFYEDFFQVKFPFKKLDMAFVADFEFHAMENVGCIVIMDEYLEREEGQFSEFKKQRIFNLILHEISHMWFGNLVTMHWWDDLWLNESFANYISAVCLDRANGLETYTKAQSVFLVETFEGLKID